MKYVEVEGVTGATEIVVPPRRYPHGFRVESSDPAGSWSWTHDAVRVVRSLEVPQLWILAVEDREAPVDLTRERLLALAREGRPIDVYEFPGTDHGMYEFVEEADGTRRRTRITEGYFRLVGDWIHGGPSGSYGRVIRLVPAAPAPAGSP